MFDRLKKHSGKAFVFIVNFLLMVIAVLVIREKDQARLLKQAENNAGDSSNTSANTESSNSNPPSFEGQIGQPVVGEQPVSQDVLQPVDSSQPVVPDNSAAPKSQTTTKPLSPATNTTNTTTNTASNNNSSATQSNTTSNRKTKTS